MRETIHHRIRLELGTRARADRGRNPAQVGELVCQSRGQLPLRLRSQTPAAGVYHSQNNPSVVRETRERDKRQQQERLGDRDEETQREMKRIGTRVNVEVLNACDLRSTRRRERGESRGRSRD